MYQVGVGFDTKTEERFNLEKFAELIITECCSATEGQPRNEIRNSILKHFGMTVPELKYGSGVNYRPTLPTEE